MAPKSACLLTMGRAVLIACVPWLALMLLSLAALGITMRCSRARPQWRRLRQLHADQLGAAQSLSFVLTLPLFVMLMLFIVQVSQLMIGQVVVEYAAFAAARAAAVWIPAYAADRETGEVESWNCVGGYAADGDASNQEPSPFGPSDGGMTYKLAPQGAKYDKIRTAAAMACLPISPSRRFPGDADPPAKILGSLKMAYSAITSGSAENVRIPDRLKHKLAYALSEDHLTVEVRFYHSNRELPLLDWEIPPGVVEFRPGQELGWQDPITVTVKYDLALLPGPGRLLARWHVRRIAGQRDPANNVYADTYTYPLSAKVTLGNEGEKPNYANYRTFNGL